MKIPTAVNFGAKVVLLGAALLFPTLGHAQQTYSGGDGGTWDAGITKDWDGNTDTWGAGNNAFINSTGTISVSGTVNVNNIEFQTGGVTVTGGTIAETAETGFDGNLINLDGGSGNVTVASQIEISDLGGNEQTRINNNSSSNLTLDNIDWGAFTFNSGTPDRRVDLEANGTTSQITLNGNYTAGANGRGFFEIDGPGIINITANANLSEISDVASFGGGTFNIANTTVNHYSFGGAGANLVNVVGAQDITAGVNDSTKNAGVHTTNDNINITNGIHINQSTADQSSWAGFISLDGSNLTLSSVAGGRLNMSGGFGGGAPLGIVINGAGTVVLGTNNYNEEDGNGFVQPTSTTAADLQSGTTLINNGTNGSAFGAASTTAQDPSFPGGTNHFATVTSVVKLEAGATLGGNGSSAPKVVAMAATSVITAGDPGQTIPGTGSNPTTVIAPSIGTLRLNGGLEADNGLTLDFKLTGDNLDPLTGDTVPGQSNDQILVPDLTLAGTVTVNLTALDPLATGVVYTLMQGAGGSWSADPATVFDVIAPTGYVLDQNYFETDPLTGLPGTKGYIFDTSDNTFTVQFELAPEPSTYGLLGLGLLALVTIARFRQLSA